MNFINLIDELKSFEAERFYCGKQDGKKKKCLIDMVSHKDFEGIKVPVICNVTLLKLEITTLDYNNRRYLKQQ